MSLSSAFRFERFLLIIVLLLSAPIVLADAIPYDSDQWVLYNAEITRHLDRDCMTTA